MKIGVVVFPGSNCDRDCGRAVRTVLGLEPVYLWHKDHDLKGVDALIIPGGFSYGDYLRCGAMASKSPIMTEIVSAANKGLPVLGICNGFQILCEAGLLPGVLMRNAGLKFICDTIQIRLESCSTAFTKSGQQNQIYQLPIAHMEGNYFADERTLADLEDSQRVVFRYVSNPNGAQHDIAGICNQNRNVVGLMPHPERVCEEILGGTDGRFFFESLRR